jgi:hypothetical protein
MIENLKKDIEDLLTMSFNVKFNKTNDNLKIFERFKQFAKEESNDNYLLAIKTLLDFIEYDWKYESLSSNLNNLNDRVSVLESKGIITEDKKEQKNILKTFGGMKK